MVWYHLTPLPHRIYGGILLYTRSCTSTVQCGVRARKWATKWADYYWRHLPLALSDSPIMAWNLLVFKESNKLSFSTVRMSSPGPQRSQCPNTIAPSQCLSGKGNKSSTYTVLARKKPTRLWSKFGQWLDTRRCALPYNMSYYCTDFLFLLCQKLNPGVPTTLQEVTRCFLQRRIRHRTGIIHIIGVETFRRY